MVRWIGAPLGALLVHAALAVAADSTVRPLVECEQAFDHIGVAEGLSSSFVTSVYRDRLGFVWISTSDGLNRYDGYDLTVYRHDPQDPNAIRGSAIGDVLEDRDGRLWVFLSAGGFDYYERDEDRFVHFLPREGDPGAPLSNHAASHAIDEKGRLCLGSALGLDRFDPELGGFEHLLGPADSIAVNALLPDGDGGLWLGTSRQGLLRWKEDSDRATRVEAAHGFAPFRGVVALERDVLGRLWILDNAGSLWIFDPASAEVSVLPHLEGGGPSSVIEFQLAGASLAWVLCTGGRLALWDGARYQVASGTPERVSAQGPRLLRSGPSGRTYFCTSNGLGIAEAGSSVIRVIRHERDRREGLSHDFVSCALEDSSGGLWVGTWGRGVDRRNDRRLRLGGQRLRLPGVDDPGFDHITSVIEDRFGTVWFGTTRGLVAQPKSGRSPILFSLVDGVAGGISSRAGGDASEQRVLSLCESADDRLWVGTGAGLFEVAPEPDGSAHVVSAHFTAGPPTHLNAVVQDLRGSLWIATGRGLIEFDPVSDKGRRHHHDDTDSSSLPSDLVSSLCLDRDGSLWVGTYIGGLSHLVPGDTVFTNYLPREGDVTSLNNRSVNSIYQSRDGRIWVGTYSGGLNLLDRSTGHFSSFTKRDGLSGHKVNRILEDDAGRLWLSTNEGLSRFDPETRQFWSFDVSDGLQSNEFSVGAGCLLRSGELIFGGVSGWNRFRPEAIGRESVPPAVALTAFSIQGRREPIARYRGERGAIELRHDVDLFAFEFTALDFANARRNRYAYKLEGYDRDWVDCGTRRYAGYTNISPGKYVFRVKAANCDGIWNEAGIAVPIVLHPPLWATSWFRISFLLALAAMLFGAHRARVHLHIRQTLALERIRLGERERVRDEVSRDFHDELGHQLTKISLFTELIRRTVNGDRGEMLRYVAKVSDSAESLARDTRDFIWTLNPEKDSLYELVANLRDFGGSLFGETDAAFEVTGLSEDFRSVRLPMDRKRQLTLIFKEAMTNVLRHSEARHVRFDVVAGDAELRFTLEDDGRGFDPAAARSGSRNGSGNGLENMKRRATRIDGQLELESAPGHGTRLSWVGSGVGAAPNGSLPSGHRGT